MMKFKHRRIIFLILIALLAGSSMAVYAESEAGFLVKTVGLVLFQQIATVFIYFACFGWDLIRSR